MSSVTFYKYCGNGFGEDRPLETGQRHAIVKVGVNIIGGVITSLLQDLEKNVQGCKALRQEIKDLKYVKYFIDKNS